MLLMLKILKWKIKIFYSNKILIALLLLLPILITAFISPSLNKESVTEITINIIDQDMTQISEEYNNRIKKDERIKYSELTYEEGIQEIEKNNISGMLIIKKGFSEK